MRAASLLSTQMRTDGDLRALRRNRSREGPQTHKGMGRAPLLYGQAWTLNVCYAFKTQIALGKERGEGGEGRGR